MGGCRCSYRNCKVRSDGQTHMFHFPVFDKMRCHQWITNSHRPNFLNLKISQLKNRVICQNHFRDDNFMNYMRDKLKPTAVPTEDGAYCISDQSQSVVVEESDEPAIPINADDIENEVLNHMEKRAHSSVKYGDFLISDVTELFNSSQNSFNSHASHVSKNRIKSMTKLFDEENYFDLKSKPQNEEDHNYTIVYSNDEPVKVSDPLSLFSSSLNPSLLDIKFEDSENLNNLDTPGPSKTTVSFHSVSKNESTVARNPDKVVNILSEKTISSPVLVAGKMKPISPSVIIRRPKKHKSLVYEKSDCDVKRQLKSDESDVQLNKNCVIPQEPAVAIESILPIEFVSSDMKTVCENNQNVTLENVNTDKQSQDNDLNIVYQSNLNEVPLKQNEEIPFEQTFLNHMMETAEKLIEPKTTKKQPIVTSTPVFKSILKNKITPEKLAAIEEKRKFNMKLRDVISSCLDNLEKQAEVPEKSKCLKKKSFSSQSIGPVSTQTDMVTYLEDRLQRMEDTLLNKIDHNTQRINELKRTIKPSSNQKHANTQTYLNHMTELSQKQYLYKEISRFLSPNAIIQVFEELFLNQEEVEAVSPTKRKLRKRR